MSILLQHLKKPVAIFGCGVSGQAVKNLLTQHDCTSIFYRNYGKKTHFFKSEDALQENFFLTGHCFNNRPDSFLAVGQTVSSCGDIELPRVLAQESLEFIRAECQDEKYPEAEPDFTEASALRHSLVVYSPGFRQDHPWFKTAQSAQCVCLGELDFAATFWRGSILAITGTNGKTTLTDFLSRALQALGQQAIPCGNIGVPLSEVCLQDHSTETMAVCEVSSFQAESLQYFSPEVLFWTNFSQDHGDHHSSLKDYFLAKYNMLAQPFLKAAFIGPSVLRFADNLGLKLPSVCKVINEDLNNIPEDSVFCSYPWRETYNLVKAYWEYKGYPLSVLRATAQDYRLLPHRQEQVADINGIKYVNDSKATNFSACLEGLRGQRAPVFWIGGGQSKGGDLESFVEELGSLIEEAFVIGQVAADLKKSFKERGWLAQTFQNLESAVLSAALAASKMAPSQASVVLSPGFSSLDQFKNYAHRGNCFKEIVLRLKTKINTTRTS